mmetsp:Transcript_3749/g.8244  ORF Transcript_3749/g.8244 Transcript_3749/m.8244 type:complete len:87 (-) Transcript_3749:350-610(-)
MACWKARSRLSQSCGQTFALFIIKCVCEYRRSVRRFGDSSVGLAFQPTRALLHYVSMPRFHVHRKQLYSTNSLYTLSRALAEKLHR